MSGTGTSDAFPVSMPTQLITRFPQDVAVHVMKTFILESLSASSFCGSLKLAQRSRREDKSASPNGFHLSARLPEVVVLAENDEASRPIHGIP